MRKTKILQLPPSLCNYELALWSPKGVPAAPTQIWLVLFGIGDPVKDLL